MQVGDLYFLVSQFSFATYLSLAWWVTALLFCVFSFFWTWVAFHEEVGPRLLLFWAIRFLSNKIGCLLAWTLLDLRHLILLSSLLMILLSSLLVLLRRLNPMIRSSKHCTYKIISFMDHRGFDLLTTFYSWLMVYAYLILGTFARLYRVINYTLLCVKKHSIAITDKFIYFWIAML